MNKKYVAWPCLAAASRSPFDALSCRGPGTRRRALPTRESSRMQTPSKTRTLCLQYTPWHQPIPRRMVSLLLARPTRVSHSPPVARHLSSLSLSGAPPSALHPQYYAAYPHGNPPPYTEYPSDVQYLTSEANANDSGYWETARTEASNMISQQTEGCVYRKFSIYVL